MTEASQGAAQGARQDDLRARLRAAGLRATPARAAVLRHLLAAGGPVTHAELVEALGDQGWDRATLYRNLTDLAGAGLVKRADMGDRLWRYELAPEAHGADLHPHFLCTTCGELSCLPEGLLSLLDDPRLPGAVRAGRVEVQVRGVCDRCGAGDGAGAGAISG